MKGAIIGDIIGSRFEFNNLKSKDFDLWTDKCKFTDDSVMTVAVGTALMDFEKRWGINVNNVEEYADLESFLVRTLHKYGNTYRHRGYGSMFKQWLRTETTAHPSSFPQPYNSWGNGAPMRCSAAGMMANGTAHAFTLGMYTAQPTHNHVEGMKAAGATASLIKWADIVRGSMGLMRKEASLYYDIPQLDVVREYYTFDVSSQGTMPVALAAFLESTDFEDAIRNAISVGGDSDTIAAITGSIAEAYYGVPDELWEKAKTYLEPQLIDDVDNFYFFLENRKDDIVEGV